MVRCGQWVYLEAVRLVTGLLSGTAAGLSTVLEHYLGKLCHLLLLSEDTVHLLHA